MSEITGFISGLSSALRHNLFIGSQQSDYSFRDLVKSFILTLESSAVRAMIFTAAGLTYATARINKGSKQLWALAGTFLGTAYTLNYFFRCIEHPVVKFHRTFWNGKGP